MLPWRLLLAFTRCQQFCTNDSLISCPRNPSVRLRVSQGPADGILSGFCSFFCVFLCVSSTPLTLITRQFPMIFPCPSMRLRSRKNDQNACCCYGSRRQGQFRMASPRLQRARGQGWLPAGCCFPRCTVQIVIVIVEKLMTILTVAGQVDGEGRISGSVCHTQVTRSTDGRHASPGVSVCVRRVSGLRSDPRVGLVGFANPSVDLLAFG